MKKIPVLFALALAAALAAGGCGSGARHAATRDAGEAVAVAAFRAASGPGEALELPARITAREEVTITARVPARLTALPVGDGARFRAGAILARFDAPESRAGLEAARAGLEAAATQRDLARRQEARMDSLVASRVAALRELEGAQAERRAAEAAWAAARAQLDQLASGLAIEAPFDGVVVRHLADPGTTLGPGQPLLDIRSTGAAEIAASVPESELPRLGSGHAEFQVGDGPWRAARLVRVDGMTDPATRSRVARFASAVGPSPEPGAFARVRLSSAASPTHEAGRGAVTAARSLTVPSRALVRRGGLSGVFVVEQGVARLRWLRVGREQDGAVEVLAGLAPDELVVASPAGLADGRAVKVTP